jgi:hypothetical protein
VEIKVCLGLFLTRREWLDSHRLVFTWNSLGRNPTRLPPGLHLNIPLYHDLQKGESTVLSCPLIWFVLAVDLRECSLAISDLPGYTSDNVSIISVPGILSNQHSLATR